MPDQMTNDRKLPPAHRTGRLDNTVRTNGMSRCLFLIAVFLFSQVTYSQCAMCRAVLESEENTAIAEGVNNGIVYLMAIPYIIVAVLFYFVYKKVRS